MTLRVKLGLFDSGIGGFSVLEELFKILPGAEVHYIADDAHVPYGNKPNDFILERCHVLTRELLFERKVDIIVVACNTATAIGITDLRANYPVPFVGIEPYLNIQNKWENKDVLRKLVVLTTARVGTTEKFKKLKEALDPENKIDHYGPVRLASIVEEAYYQGLSKDSLLAIEEELLPLQGKGYTHVILGCTHYPLISKHIERILQVECISPGASVAMRTKNILSQSGIVPDGSPLPDFFHFKSTKETVWRKWKRSEIFIRE